MPSTDLQAIITDIDGTVAETEDYHRKAYNALFEWLDLDVHWDREEYGRRLSQVGGSKFYEIMEWKGVPEDERAETRIAWYDWKTETFTKLVCDDLRSGALPVREGIIPLFEEAAAEGIILGAASTSVKSAAIAMLEASVGEKLFARFKPVRAGDDTPHKKPEPHIFLQAAEVCGVAPEACMGIEDTPHGCASAKNAGMSCIVAPSEFCLDLEFPGADAVYPNLRGVTLAQLREVHQNRTPGS